MNLKLPNINFKKLDTFDIIVLGLLAVGFMTTGRWLYHRIFPEEHYTVEVDL